MKYLSYALNFTLLLRFEVVVREFKLSKIEAMEL
jgi:hypothetical protein